MSGYYPTADRITDERLACRVVRLCQHQPMTLVPRTDIDRADRLAAYGRLHAELTQALRVLDEAGNLTRNRPQARRLLANVTGALDELRAGADRPRVSCDWMIYWA